ncbi:Phosphatidylinositol 3,4,5-trisphosphate 3-phosphatase and protein-tyrosine-phosphatase PTEN1 [Camellia lanceoleosa]|uniref:Phosphatidylinositol 3,4,5-trisphosphate 3-phosphatase and protein-tyrosine-phosphatase PTEN1 n=1 Tax=Camellia lanceoleosa TaxID=1840588 RepID=A0ACC0I4I7_9ERIC|nr:Phosphatidylinositol 3,4,5-trisphosphate 3-phosphatase and protein-tyrosine-phosphatase PTEN1 [Camellia lanceoleosa]
MDKWRKCHREDISICASLAILTSLFTDEGWQGRTGLMVSAYLVYSGMSAEEALQVYAHKRTTNNEGVPYITTALMDAKLGTEGRKDLFDWLSRQLSGLSNFPDANGIALVETQICHLQ